MKKGKIIFVAYILIVSILFLINSGYAENETTDKPSVPNAPAPDMHLHEKQPPVPMEKIASGIFQIGEIQINKKMMLVSFPAQINMDKGLLEYLVVRKGGKTHESLLRTDIDPYNIQIAFLLLGLEGTDRPLPQQGSSLIPKGEPLEIYIAYRNKENKLISVKCEDWITIKTKNEQKSISRLDWVFTGSTVFNGQFLAQSSGSIAALYHDPAAIIDNASEGGDSDEIWYVKEDGIPPVGTPVTINIKTKGKKY